MSQPDGSTAIAERTEDEVATAEPWVTLVWDDPINLMPYVTHVFCTYFKYPKAKAERLMWKVHTEGKAVVASGTLEEMERDANAMHSFGLWATVDRAT